MCFNNVLLFIALFHSSLENFCPQKNDLQNYAVKEETQMCIAQCLGLYKAEETGTNSKKCSFNLQTGAAIGDTCGENFQAVSKSKLLFCELLFQYWKACDFIYHSHAIHYVKAKNTIIMRTDAMKLIAPRITDAKSFGIKNLMRVGSPGEHSIAPGTLSDIADDPKKRERFVVDLLDIVQKYDFDGVYIYWKYPGCPASTCNRPKDKQNIIPFFKELFKLFQPAGKRVVFYTTALHTMQAWYLDNYFNDIGPYVDNIVLEVSPQGDLERTSMDPTYSFFKMKLALKSFTAKLQPQYVKKIVATMAMQTALSKLIDPKAAAMFSKIDKSSNRWAGIAEICAAAANSSWKMEKNMEIQHTLTNSVDIMSMDDLDSMKVKMDFIHQQNFGGVLIESTAWDDQLGTCGCGRMMWLRTVGELLKGGGCEIKKCF